MPGWLRSLLLRRQVNRTVAQLQSCEWVESGEPVRWPADDARDRAFVETLMRDFPTTDLDVEITRWAAWLSEEPRS
jgi:hypothetical protein